MGSLRVRELLHPLENETTHYEQIVEELVHNQILGFKKLHLKDRKAEHIILLGNTFIERMLEKMGSIAGKSNAGQFSEFYGGISLGVMSSSPEEISVALGISFGLCRKYGSSLDYL